MLTIPALVPPSSPFPAPNTLPLDTLNNLVLLLTAVGIFTHKINARWLFYVELLIGMVFLCVYYFKLEEVFSYVYPAVIVTCFSQLYLCNIEDVSEVYNRGEMINKLVLSYLIINVFLYFYKDPTFFQMEQYKGALPHTNMFGSVMVSLYILIFWNGGWISLINKSLIFFLVLVSMSRTFIAMVVAVVLINLATVFWRRIKFVYKLILGLLIAFSVGGAAYNYLITIVPSLSRFGSIGFGGNGRELLQTTYLSTISNSSLSDKALGFPMAKNYITSIPYKFNHSFAENTFIAFFLLFGVLGLIALACYFIKIIRLRKNPQTVLIVVLMTLCMLTQDIWLSVQIGILSILSLSAFARKEGERINRKREYLLNENKSLGVR